jgi:hypothetical protein
MTRHEPLPAQTETSPSRPASHLAPVDAVIAIALQPAPIRRDKLCPTAISIAPRDPLDTAPSHSPSGPKAGQIQKYP